MTCEQCKFYQSLDVDVGACMRYPPSMRPDYGKITCYPAVKPDNWCGEFKKAPAKPK